MLREWLTSVAGEGVDSVTLRAEMESLTPEVIRDAALGRDGPPETLADLLRQRRVIRFFDFLYPRQEEQDDPVQGSFVLRSLAAMIGAGVAPAAADAPAWSHFDADGIGGAGIARAWRRALRSGDQPVGDESRRSLFVLAAEGGQHGRIGRLLLRRVPQVESGASQLPGDPLAPTAQPGDLSPDPMRMGLWPLSERFRQAIADAVGHVRAAGLPLPDGVDFLWRLEGLPQASLSGGSLGGAFALALRLLRMDELIAQDFALSATVQPDAVGTLGPVEAIGAKVRAALELPQIQTVLVHPDNEAEARAACLAAGRDPEQVLKPVRTIDECLGHACLLEEWFRRRERQRVRELAGERLGREFPDDASLAAHCLIPLVREEGGEELGKVGEPADWQALRAGIDRAQLVAGSGYGKTTLLWSAVANPADERPVFLVPAIELAQVLPETEPPREWLADALAALLAERHQLAGQAEPWLRQRIVAGECLVTIDALNEVSVALRGGLALAIERFLKSDAGAASRLWIATHPDTLVGSERLRTFYLDAFDAPRIRRFMANWFDRSGGAAVAALERLMEVGDGPGGGPAALLRVPLYLRLACQVAARSPEALARVRRRVALQERFLEYLRDEWGQQWPVPPPYLRDTLLDFASDVAYRLYCRQGSQERAFRSGWGRLQGPVQAALQALQPTSELQQTLKSLLERLEGDPGRGQSALQRARAELHALRDRIDEVLFAPESVSAGRTQWARDEFDEAVFATLQDARYGSLRGRDLIGDLFRLRLFVPLVAADRQAMVGFAHQALGDHLSARSLARRARPGWADVAEEVAALAARGESDEMLILLAGLLDDPTFLLDMLMDERRDDAARSRLALAAECFREIALES